MEELPNNTVSLKFSTLIQRDLACVWHPYTQSKTSLPPIPIVKGKGPYLYADDGSRYLDAISSWWVNLHGHAHPYIADKLAQQTHILEHVIFAGFTHEKAIELAERLIRILPGEMAKIFYSDNGSTAVEVGLKMAIQYWHNLNPMTDKIHIVRFKHSYHGDTIGAMSASGTQEFNRPFRPFLYDTHFIDPPEEGMEKQAYLQLKGLLESYPCACLIFEPLVQGAGGMRTHSPQGLSALLKLCREYSVITIADEVMTGFGRTGPLFACQSLTCQPDIICLSKGLTGGFLPLGATACKQYIFDAFASNCQAHALLHGHSYTANPLACTAALASLDLLESQECALQREKIQLSHRQFKDNYGQHPKLKRCEAVGTVLILEYSSDSQTSYFHPLRDKLYHYCLSKKILLRPLGNVLYVLPPYCISQAELKEIYQTIQNTFEEEPWK